MSQNQFISASKIASILALVVFSFGLQSFLKPKSRKQQDTLVLGTMSGWPPYVTINDKGQYEGLDIDLAQALAQKLNKKLEIQDMDTASLILALEQSKVDFIMTGLSITQERLQKIAMIPYQGEAITQLPLVFWKEIPTQVQTLSDLEKIQGAVVCVEPGSPQEKVLEKYPNITTKQLDPLASVLEVKYGKALAVLLEPAFYNDLKSKYPELVALQVPLAPEDQILGNGIGVKKTNTELVNKLTALVEQFKQDGFITDLEKKWLAGTTK